MISVEFITTEMVWFVKEVKKSKLKKYYQWLCRVIWSKNSRPTIDLYNWDYEFQILWCQNKVLYNKKGRFRHFESIKSSTKQFVENLPINRKSDTWTNELLHS